MMIASRIGSESTLSRNCITVRELAPSCDAAIALCSDAQMFPLAFVLASRLARTARGRYDVHLLSEPNAHIARVPPHCPFGIELPAFLDSLPATVRNSRFHSFSNMRLFVPEILSARYRRILYLDCDIRVEAPVAPLFQLDMGGAPIAAVDDYTLPFLPHANPGKNDRVRQRRDEIGHSATDPYFNAGVMLMDAVAWRSDGMTNNALTILDRLASVGGKNQEMLNVLFCNRWAALSPRWNFTFFHDLGFEPLLQPAVFHYAGAKPWELRWDRDPSHFKAFADMFVDTPFADYRHPEPGKAEYLDALLKAIKWSVRRRTSIARPGEIARRVRDSHVRQMRAVFASYLIESIRKRRFIDVRAEITTLNEEDVREVVQIASKNASK